jgi:hypothetical protein
MRTLDIGLEDRAGATVRDDDRRRVLLDEVVGRGVGLLADRLVGRLGALVEGLDDIRERRPELLARAGAEVVVEEVGGVRIVGTPAEQEDAVEGPRRVGVEEGAGLLQVELGLDPEVVAELARDLRRDLRRIGQVAADGLAELQLVGLVEIEVGGGRPGCPTV